MFHCDLNKPRASNSNCREISCYLRRTPPCGMRCKLQLNQDTCRKQDKSQRSRSHLAITCILGDWLTSRQPGLTAVHAWHYKCVSIDQLWLTSVFRFIYFQVEMSRKSYLMHLYRCTAIFRSYFRSEMSHAALWTFLNIWIVWSATKIYKWIRGKRINEAMTSCSCSIIFIY